MKFTKKNIDIVSFIFLFLVFLVLVTIIYIKRINYTQAEKDFIFLAKILKTETKNLSGKSEKLKRMTDWLHENVKHVGKYPPNFNGSSIPNVIRGGVGNCGYQSCNIIGFANLLGESDSRIYHSRKELGAYGQHAFAEIKVNNKWEVYDPDLIQYQLNEAGKVMGLRDMLVDTSQVENKLFKEIIVSMVKNKAYKVTGPWLKAPTPFGKAGYTNFEKKGMLYILRSS